MGMQINQEEMAPQSFFHTALETKEILKHSGGLDGWPSDSSDLTLENAIDSVPVRLFNFIAWSVGFSEDPVMDERVAESHSQCCKVVSICQDLIYAESKGKKQTHKAIALGMAARQVTGFNSSHT